MATPDQSSAGTGASDQPAGNAQGLDLEQIVSKVVAAVTAQTDTRMQGFQSLIDRKFSTLERQFKTAGLSPEEQEQLAEQDKDSRIAELERELALAQSRDRFPKGADLLSKLRGAESLEDQLALIEAAFQAGQISEGQAAQAAQAAANSAGGETPVPEVDRNSPAREIPQGVRSAIDSGEMNDEMADAILNALG